MEIERLTGDGESRWNEYIAKSPDTTFYHQLGWRRVIEKTYGLRSMYLTAVDEGELVGILPLFFMESRVFGNKLISLPYAPYGGISPTNGPAAQMIFDEIRSMAGDMGVRHIELRNLSHQNFESSVDTSYVTLILELDRDLSGLWGRLRKSMRRYVKKSMENKLEVIRSSRDARSFYGVYSPHMRDLGSPVHSYDFFKNMLEEFPSSSHIASVILDDHPVASIFLMKFKDTMIYGWGASGNRYLDLFPNYLLFWETIKSCAGSGIRQFDFGRSMPTEGTYAFKAGWGAEPRQLFYQYYPADSSHGEIKKTSFRRRIFTGLWKRVPVPLANALGPSLRKRIS
jgi:FemAB-related protein (PEP-CTERM system-associated)